MLHFVVAHSSGTHIILMNSITDSGFLFHDIHFFHNVIHILFLMNFGEFYDEWATTKCSIVHKFCSNYWNEINNLQIIFIFGTQKADGELKNKIFGENCVFQRGLILQVLSGRKLGIEAIKPNFLTKNMQYETCFTLLFSS